MKIGELVMFPHPGERYQMRPGLLLGYHDNPSDLKNDFMKRLGRPARQVADILCEGNVVTCWAKDVRSV